ncbi:MAG TPA: site-2 protease family protein [Planctomycetota bacterium]|nr:site-2 protease family protein [Planctomycetota bacterium]
MDSALSRCPDCGAEQAPDLLSCPSCGRLVHAATLKKLAADAEAAEKAGELSAALIAWRDALELLPPNTRQHAGILERIRGLSARVEEGGPQQQGSTWKKGAAGLSGLALLLFKFKSFGVLLLTKGKFILLGLTKAPTLFSMLLSMWYYFLIWGWKFGVGFVLSIYIHEMGHVWLLHKYGIRATAPMFIPGLGAVIRSGAYQSISPVEDARVGLAGPMWGLGAAAICYGVYVATGLEYWGALAQAGGMLNLFNLIPVWQLDGSRGLHSLTKGQRWLLAAAVGATYWFTSTTTGDHDVHRQNVFLAIIGVCTAFRAVAGEAPKQRDDFGLFQFVLLIITLGALASIHIPMAARMR